MNNQILLKEKFDNLSVPTVGGLIKGAVSFKKNQFLSVYANRVYEVVKTCDQLTLWSRSGRANNNALRWKCELEVSPGDTVITSYMAAIDYDAIFCQGELYMLANYAELRVAIKPGGEVVMLNGWVAYEHPILRRSSVIIDPNAQVDYTRGVVVMTGKKNAGYVRGDKRWVDLDGPVDVSPGDTFIKDNKGNRLVLEDPQFRLVFKRELYVIMRKSIVGIEA